MLAFGVTSFVLGMIGFMLFFLPILGAPISVVGLACGIIGCVVAGATFRGSLRWSVAGVVLCLLALSINCAIAGTAAARLSAAADRAGQSPCSRHALRRAAGGRRVSPNPPARREPQYPFPSIRPPYDGDGEVMRRVAA